MKRQILLSQLGATLSALWIGWVPAALAQGIGSAKVVTQAPCAFCLQFTGAESIDHFKQTLTFSAPSRGVAVVTAHGSLVCTYTVSSPVPAIIDLPAQIVRDSEHVDIADGPGRLLLFAQLPAHGATTFNLASTRTFEVEATGEGARHDFHLRLRRNSSQSPNTSCHLRDVALTIHFVGT